MSASDDVRDEILAAFDLTEQDMEQFERHPLFAAQAERRAREAAYRATLPQRRAFAAAEATAVGHREGWLPPGLTFEYAPVGR
jgi:hypothetical protein